MSKLKLAATGITVLSMFGAVFGPAGVSAQSMSMHTYDVTITNLTTKQALSPPIIASHPASVHAWQMGQPASKGLEIVAEEGMSDMLAAELKGVATDVVAAHAHLLPGDAITLRVTAHEGDVLSAASMLIQTNDGFTGLDSVPLVAGEKTTMAYDAGTEENTELAADVPGPPFGGKNHGPDTNPRQPVSMHPGIAGKADVTPDFNWSGPVASFAITAVDTSAPSGPAYEVTITNINNSMQALSPPIIATHPASAHAWQMGQPASKGLELLAEEGMSDMLASELKGVATDVVASHAHLLPGDSITLRIAAKEGDVLSAATMLVQTNDGFTGLDNMALSGSMSDKDAMAYDAGTEENTELAADVPGPPLGGKNHGPDSNPRQPVSMHPGITGKADVPAAFSWSGPVARFSVKSIGTSGESMPVGMPHTGAGTSTLLAVALGASLLLLLSGVVVRRAKLSKR